MHLARTLAREDRLEELRQRAGGGDEYARYWLELRGAAGTLRLPSTTLREAAAALSAAGMRTVGLSARSSKDAVRVGTMHGMKDLEFQAVAVIGVADGISTSPTAARRTFLS
jgi:superfamily I DNA/RNA helicase